MLIVLGYTVFKNIERGLKSMNDREKRRLQLESLHVDPKTIQETLSREFPDFDLEDAKQAVLEKIDSEVDRIRQESQNRQDEYENMLEDHGQKLEEARAEIIKRFSANYQRIFKLLEDFEASEGSLVLLFQSSGKNDLKLVGSVSVPRILGLKDLVKEEVSENEKTSD
jgi:transcriptional regulator of heat shock response